MKKLWSNMKKEKYDGMQAIKGKTWVIDPKSVKEVRT